jgi:1-deoxy-D-xylulose-5-phosphate reductoisomerase
VLNAANEIAVEEFLAGRLAFPGIPRVIERAMDAYEDARPSPVDTLADVRHIDTWARQYAARATAGVQS